MKIYLVGGAVRDQLLDYPFTERDWVVVGATPQFMLEQGYKQVGKDFPVFLHPHSKEEYALARTERKSGQGYHGFEMDVSQSVTLEQDLKRRDLTINAIAMDEQGRYFDPFQGRVDLKNKVLRHISPSFCEDPLRVLRVARFAARYHHLGFRIAKETISLMGKLAQNGELETLSAERVWKETQQALTEKSPQVYFQTLRDCGALKYWFSELNALWGIPNPPQWHPEVDTGIHTMMVVEQAAKLSQDPITRFAALCHDLGKGKTPRHLWPKHYGHEKAGVALVQSLCKRLRAPKVYASLASIASEFHLHMHRITELKPKTLLTLLEKIQAFRQAGVLYQYLDVCEADFKGRTGFEEREYPQREFMLKAANACKQVKSKPFIDQGYQGEQLGEVIFKQRLTLLKQTLSQLPKITIE